MSTEWDVNLLRLSVFCTGTTSTSDEIWKLLTGQDEAENRAAVPGGRRFSGKFAGGLLTLASAGPRLDLVLQAVDGDTNGPKLPVIDPWTNVRSGFTQMSLQLLASVKIPIVRIAFGSIFLAKQHTLEDCYQKLKNLLNSVHVDPKRMRDLHYRVNWQRDSKVAPIKMNRLTTWAAMQFSTSLLQVIGNNVAVAGGGQEQFAVRLECDHNTDAANLNPIEGEKIALIFRELVELASENAEKGEIIS